MISLRSIVQLLLFGTGPTNYSYSNPKIQWGPCNESGLNSTVPIQCGNLLVPLDYTHQTSNETLKLELLRVPAPRSPLGPSKGSILFNFGGPGATARGSLALLAEYFQYFTRYQYDLVAFDPRGTGNTLQFSCVDTDLEKIILLNEWILGNSSDVALGRLWARGEINSNICLKKANETGRLIGTAFVARDLIRVVDALDEDGMLRYWGFSYGTTLGATVASMLPDRIDKMILDGVQNPHQYYRSPADFEEWTDSDKVFSGIFSACVAAPSNCALARGRWGVTATELENSIWDLINTVKHHPIPMGTFMLDYTALKAIIVQSLYSTALWPQLTSLLDNLLRGNIDGALAELESYPVPTEEELNIPMAIMGIHCGDRTPRVSSFEEFRPAVDRLYGVSKFMGDVTPGISMTCAQWKMEAKERYEGNFQVQTRKPVLLIGNTFDGLTPLASAHNVSSGLKGSVVLEVNGYGHSSLSLPSLCTFLYVSLYWRDVPLPPTGKVCRVDKQPFSNVTWGDVFVQASGEDSSLAKRDVSDFSVPVERVLGRRWLM